VAYYELRQLLTRGAFQPGQRLLEVELSRQLGVSRTPIREALRRLQSDGLIVAAGRGAAVAMLMPSQVNSLYQFRASLEALTAELAAARNAAGEISMSQVRQLMAARDAVEAADDPRAVSEANLALHRYIADLSNNEFAIESLSRVWDKIALSSLTNVSDSEWLTTIHQQHLDIVGAITAGDAVAAGKFSRKHVESAAGVYISHATNDPSTPLA
jgi:DNA-binding GntR family transcriptional regulator